MPIYAYRCDHCGHTQDTLQKMSDPPLVTCPSCGQPTLRKQVTAAGFQLKGSGWYVTDFRNPAATKGGAADGAKAPATATSEGASDGKSGAGETPAPAPAAGGNDSKPAATSTASPAPPPAKPSGDTSA